MAYRNSRSKLSKHILDMKFMKRSKEKVEKEIEDEEREAMFSHEITEGMKYGACKYIIEPSFVPCESLIVGRMSFHGMNPDIEKLMQAEDGENNEKLQAKKEKCVSDEEMANMYNTLVGTVGRKFHTKRERTVLDQRPARPQNIDEPFPTKQERTVLDHRPARPQKIDEPFPTKRERTVLDNLPARPQKLSDEPTAKKKKFLKPKD